MKYSQKVELPEPIQYLWIDDHDEPLFSKQQMIKFGEERVAKALEAAIMQVPGGDSCNPQHVADAIRNLIGEV